MTMQIWIQYDLNFKHPIVNTTLGEGLDMSYRLSYRQGNCGWWFQKYCGQIRDYRIQTQRNVIVYSKNTMIKTYYTNSYRVGSQWSVAK